MFLNAYHEPMTFVLPETADQDRWILLIDTRLPLPRSAREFTHRRQVRGDATVRWWCSGCEAEGATRQVLMDLEAAIHQAAKAQDRRPMTAALTLRGARPDPARASRTGAGSADPADDAFDQPVHPMQGVVGHDASPDPQLAVVGLERSAERHQLARWRSRRCALRISRRTDDGTRRDNDSRRMKSSSMPPQVSAVVQVPSSTSRARLM